MSSLSGFVQKIIPFVFMDSINTRLNRSYNRFRIALFILMLGMAMGPVTMTAGLGYFNYKDLLQKEEYDQLEARLDGSIKSIEAQINSLTSVIQFVAREDRYTELLDGDNLKELFLRLKRRYEFFADIGIIDDTGLQQEYYGPYQLQGTDYSEETWLKEAVGKGLNISTVYTGYRQVPHFTIGVSNRDPDSGKIWVLRTTINAATLQRFVDTIKTNVSDDLFLVNSEGHLQTSSVLFGPPLSQINFPINPGLRMGISGKGENVFYGAGKIVGSPWSLVLVEKHYVHHQEWTRFRARLLFILIACLIISMIIVYILVTILTNLIHKADEMQMTMLREAEHTDKLASIGRLAAGVGHEINNPLAIINQKAGLAEDLLEITPPFQYKETIQDSLLGIHKSVERCKAITHRLLGFARRGGVQRENLQVNEIIKEVLLFLENSMIHNRIQVEQKFSPDLPPITSDQLQLQQVFLNIINNGIDAAGKDGTISISTELVDQKVQIIIEDNGHGIAEDILPYIFEPFFTTKDTGKGTGLGLSITYGLIKKLSGDINVQSTVGQGTAFTLTFPLKSETNDQK
ncbi:MAG: sensor histidine kinase [Desulforhopalus sp.]